MKKKKPFEMVLYSAIGVVVMLLIVVAVNVLLGVVYARVDLTQEKLYTLSEGTRAILAKLDTPVKVRFYYSRSETQMPLALKNYARQVEDLLSEYRQHSGGKLTIEKLDPQPDTDAEDSANLDGLEGQMIDLGTKIYLGIAVSCVDQKETIPFLLPDREKLLEYDLSRAISRVVQVEKPVVGVMSSLPVFGAPMNPMMMQMGQRGQEPWVFISELKRDFDVRTVETSVEEIPSEITVLMTIHAKGLSDATMYAIDQFILRGGKLLAMVDPFSMVDDPGPGMNPLQRASSSTGSSLDKLFQAWGIAFESAKVVADMQYITQIRAANGQPQANPAILSLTKEAINGEDPVTGQTDNVLLAYPGMFSGTPVAGLTQTVLLKTSQDSELVDRMMAQLAGEQITKDFKASGKNHSLAVRLSGKFKTAFPEGKPAAAPAEGEEKPAAAPAPGDSLKESQRETSVVLIGDSDMVVDQVCVRIQNLMGSRIAIPFNGNLSLAQGIIEQLAGDNNLIQVRSRATVNRPFTVVKERQARAEAQWRDKQKELQASLAEAQQKLNELQRTKQEGQRFILSPEQRQEIENFRKKEADVSRELRVVQKQLKKDVDALETQLKWINIAGMPFLVTFCGISLAVMKRKKTAAR